MTLYYGRYNGNGRKMVQEMELLLKCMHCYFQMNPIALDSVMCKLVDINPEFVPTMKPGKEWGLGTYLYDEIEK
jgi:hypothetical protein